MHTTLEIVIGEKDGFIRAAKETLIKAALYWVPIFILISTGQNQNEPEAGEFFFKMKDGASGQAIKANCSAREKIMISPVEEKPYCPF